MEAYNHKVILYCHHSSVKHWKQLTSFIIFLSFWICRCYYVVTIVFHYFLLKVKASLAFIFEHIDHSSVWSECRVISTYWWRFCCLCNNEEHISVCIQSAGAAEASVPSTEGPRIWSQTREHITHIPAIVSVQSHTTLSRWHEERGKTHTFTG